MILYTLHLTLLPRHLEFQTQTEIRQGLQEKLEYKERIYIV